MASFTAFSFPVLLPYFFPWIWSLFRSSFTGLAPAVEEILDLAWSTYRFPDLPTFFGAFNTLCSTCAHVSAVPTGHARTTLPPHRASIHNAYFCKPAVLHNNSVTSALVREWACANVSGVLSREGELKVRILFFESVLLCNLIDIIMSDIFWLVHCSRKIADK